MSKDFGVERNILWSRNLQGFEQAEPAIGAGGWRLVEAKLEVDVDEAGGVLGALEVAGHPIKVVGDAGEHRGFPVVVHKAILMRGAPMCLCYHRLEKS